MAETFSSKETDTDEIDLSIIFAVLWQQWKLILFGTLGATILSIIVSFYIPKMYLSEGFFQLGSVKTDTIKPPANIKTDSKSKIENQPSFRAIMGIPIQLYKIIYPQFLDPHYFQLVASQNNLLDEKKLKELKTNFKSASDINQWIKPVYAHAKEDAREFVAISKDEYNSVIGLNLSYEADSPEKASDYVRFFGEYIRDCLLYDTLHSYIRNQHSFYFSEMNRCDNNIIESKFLLLQNTNKLQDIQVILTKYPESAKIESRQLVSVQEGGDRFLAPVTQLVGIESTLAELRLNLADLERDKEIFAILAEFFSRCDNELTKLNRNGSSLYLLTKTIKNEVFKSKDSSKDTVKEAFNNLSNDLEAFELAFFSNCRFVFGPTIPHVHFKPRKGLLVIVSCFISFLLLAILAFVSYWWHSNKRKIRLIKSKNP